MRRREFVAGATLLVTVSRAAAQQSAKPQRLAIVSTAPIALMQENSSNRYYRAIFAELRRLGHLEGENLTVERYGKEQSHAGLDALAVDVVRSNPDAILSIGDGSLQMKAATTTIPLVIWDYDPIGRGLIKSLAHPGGNITGVVGDIEPSIWGKRVELLREAFPAMEKLAFLGPHNRLSEAHSAAVRSACEALRLPLVTALYDLPAGETEYRKAIADAVGQGANAIVVTSNPDAFDNRALLTEAIGQARLPAIYPIREFIEVGGLMAYGADFVELSQRVADDIDAILRGAKPGDIPFFGGQRFKLSINLKTAKVLGLTPSPLLLGQADEVID